MVIAIDGPSGVGKSTVARALAARLGSAYLNTGAYYRAATLAALRAAVDLEDDGAVTSAVAAARYSFDAGHMYLDGRDVSQEIRSPEVTAHASRVAAIPEVRRIMVAQQRAWVEARAGDAVVEGRDIGTVVFPAAPLKVFLEARPEVRATRRASDHEAAGLSEQAVLADLARRDHIDSSREASPLQPAADAVVIDTSDLGIHEVIDRVMELTAARRRH